MHARSANQAAKRINAEAASSWYESFAGTGAIDLIFKVYGRDAPIAAPLREIEFVASHAVQLNQAIQGQEALGLFSIRCSPALGLDISGRALADSTKRALRERHGLTDAGWRLLRKLPSGPNSAAFEWTGLFEIKPDIQRDPGRGGISGARKIKITLSPSTGEKISPQRSPPTRLSWRIC